MGALHGFEVDVVELIEDVEGVVSSSRIRTSIEAGLVEEAATALTTMYRLANVVVSGDKRGRTLGFPTANLRPPERKVIPEIGVYAGFGQVDGVTHQAAISVGIRPTFGGGEGLVEVYLLDYEGDMYDNDLSVEFAAFLRPELNFDDVDELVDQMHTDVERTLEILKVVSSDMG
jgi:riboflavin kinase/FMN adenylyltransferase